MSEPENPTSAQEPATRSRQVGRVQASKRILLFGHVRELALYRAQVLRDRGFNVTVLLTDEESIAAIRRGNFDVAIVTYTLPNQTVQEFAELVREYCPHCPLIAISDTGRVDRKVDPDEIVLADDGPPALIAALRRATRT